MTTEIYVVTHKKYEFPKYSIYKPIIAGAFEYSKNQFPNGYIRDDQGDNISDKHDLYSEYTVTYWIWKNTCADNLGINHYRRYFIKGGWLSYFRCLINPKKRINKYVLNEGDINSIIDKGYNCILPKKQWRVNRTLKDEFISANKPELLESVEQIIKMNYPEYLNAFYEVMSSRENYQKCICIMERTKFDAYASWIFGIFNKLTEKGLEGNNREYAFLGERLINVWVEYQKNIKELKIAEHFFVNVEFQLTAIIKNHTEFFIPMWMRSILKVVAQIGIEVVIGNGKCKIQRKRK